MGAISLAKQIELGFAITQVLRGRIARMSATKPLTDAQLAFVAKLKLDPARNATAAYEAVYKARGKAAGVNASRLLADPRVQAALSQADAETRKSNALTVERLAEHLRELVEADPRDLIDYRRGACRHCWGVDFKYQRKQSELERDIEAYKAQNRLAHKKGLVELDPMAAFFDYAGGVGFMRTRAPNPDCPECEGIGEGYEFPKDLRDVPPAAARLYAGLKITREGFEIKTRSQDKMLELAMRAAGMLTEKGDKDDDEAPPAMNVTYAEEDASDPANDALRGSQ